MVKPRLREVKWLAQIHLARRKILKYWAPPKGVYPGNGRVGNRITTDPVGES